MNALPPLSLYVHLPWCERKCPYCDFNSHAVRETLPESEYVAALLADLEQELPLIWGRRIVSVFIGGGTPSLFSVDAIETLLSGLRARLALLPDAEITMEANPGSSEQSRFSGYRAAGVNRLSLGVQSFNDDALRELGRVHDGDQARGAIAAAQAAGFENLNIDLMYALPNQSPDQALHDLQTACELEPAHVSWYQLTIEPNTLFHRYPPSLPDEDVVADIEQAGWALLSEAGYGRYEVSAYARDKKASRHNLNYWQFGDYLGIGAGAHGKLSHPEPRRVWRYAKQRQPAAYQRCAATAERLASERTLDTQDLTSEFLLNALRLVDGFEPALYQQHTGQSLDALEPILSELCAEGLMQRDEHRITTTPTGFQFLNDVLARFAVDA